MTSQTILTLEELDDALDELPDEYAPGMYDAFIGQKVDWHGSLEGVLTTLADGGIYIQVELTCRCGSQHETVYLGSGLHRGAWCYAYNEKGEYQANLRDQDYVCEKCTT